MIRLKSPLNYRGLLYQAGEILPVSPELAAKMIKAGTAEAYVPVEKVESKAEQTEAVQPETESPQEEPETPPKEKGGKR